jgi:hypothetical protein
MLRLPKIITLAKLNNDDKSHEYVRSLADICYSIHLEMREFTHTTTSTLSCHVVESNVSILDN